MKENDEKKKGLFSAVKELLGVDSVETEYDENDTGILDFTTTDDPIEEEVMKEKPKKQKTFFGKAKTTTATKEIFSTEDDGALLTNCQTIFVDPKSFEDAKKIANYVVKDKMITINLESLEIKVAQRLMDFLAGAMKIKEASFVPISRKVYTIVPKSMKVYYEGKKDGKKSILEIEREE